MNADVLANLLLELNVLNVKDIDRELKVLAANIQDPRAQKWLQRVARHFIINIDQLMTQPYRAKAEPRGHHGSKYYYDPKGGWHTGQEPAQPENPSKWWGETPMAGDPNACQTCGGSGFVKEIQPVNSLKTRKVPWTTHDPEEEKITCPTCRGTGVKTKFAEGIMLEAPEEEYEPDPPGVYTSRLHEPVVQKDIWQNFSPYQTKKAPKRGKELFGGPPMASKVEPWVKQREKEQEIHYFDPIQTRRRELWVRLESFVNYANWMSTVASKAASENPQEQIRAKTAEQLFRRLETMHTGDIDGFREMMREAESFKNDIRDRPWIYMDDPKLVAEQGSLKLLRVALWQTAVNFSSRVCPTGKGSDERVPSWCTKMKGNAESYTEDGPLYFVDKRDKPYVLVHFESNQAKDVGNMDISEGVAAEIAPLFIDPKRFPMSVMTSNSRGFGSGVGRLANAIAKLRRQKGIHE